MYVHVHGSMLAVVILRHMQDVEPTRLHCELLRTGQAPRHVKSTQAILDMSLRGAERPCPMLEAFLNRYARV